MDKRTLISILVFSHTLVLAVLGFMLAIELSPLLIIGIVSLLIAGVLIVIHRYLKGQYTIIAKVARRIAGGEFNQRVPSMELDEFDRLGKEINSMLGRLDDTIDHLGIHREELRLVLGSIEDVLWSQSYEGSLEWVNGPFESLFPAYDASRKQQYWEVIRNSDLLERIREAEKQAEKYVDEIQLDGHSYILSISHNDKTQRRIFILQNIDVIQQTTQMKRDFIVNLAHELRTPLTAIKGFAEAMNNAPGRDYFRYLKIIQNHTNRLIHLIRDLEQLIRLESSAQLDMQDIDLSAFFANIRLVLEQEVAEKGLELRIELDSSVPRLSCDPFRFEQIFINLVQNSLRYTERGGITIRSIAEQGAVCFEVEDTGRGIAAEHLPRIFERFYVADPSRNKSQSGTGLGLAIVKHIVLLHKGSIEVSSQPGQGTCFRIQLPQQIKQGGQDNAK